MLNTDIVNKTSRRVPVTFIHFCLKFLGEQLKRKGLLPSKRTSVLLVFVSKREIRSLNRKYRGRDKATDVLSFAPIESAVLGELVFSLDVIEAQSKEHGLSLRLELGYLMIHGVLHLLGFDHERSQSEALIMFELQDDMFERLSRRWNLVRKRSYSKKSKS